MYELGKPDVFVTCTFNPACPELLRECNKRGFNTPDQAPWLVSRIFNLKKQRLFDDIVKGARFGRVVAYCWTQEYQKRGIYPLKKSFQNFRPSARASARDARRRRQARHGCEG